MSNFPIQIRIREDSGMDRIDEPVSIGVPLPMGGVRNAEELRLQKADGSLLPMGCRILARWPDGSIRQVLIDSQLSVCAGDTGLMQLTKGEPPRGEPSKLEAPRAGHPQLHTTLSGDQLMVDTQAARFGMGRGNRMLRWMENGRQSRMTMMSEIARISGGGGEVYLACPDTREVVHDTGLKKTIGVAGVFREKENSPGPEFEAFFHFYAGKPWIRIDFLVRNPEAALHKGGAWDLGNENSFLFKDLSLTLKPEGGGGTGQICCRTGAGQIMSGEDLALFQASSGQPAWDSRVHVNRQGKVPLAFKGYRLYQNGQQAGDGRGAEPWVAWSAKDLSLSCYCPLFWQNSPGALSVDKNGLYVGLFPNAHEDGFELLPGEQKTQTVYLSVGDSPEKEWSWARDPLIAEVLADSESRDGLSLTMAGSTVSEPYDRLVSQVLEGEFSFMAKNRLVDEYGWRNFGDVWADHESALSDRPLVSHYNNQYDLIKGMVVQFRRFGDPRWFRLANQMADHVADIDIYHTRKDRPQYNLGMFWHTDHHLEAFTSGHRTISIAHKALKPRGCFGGGPAPDHNYATGLLELYWMTGEPRYKTAVTDLAENVIQWLTAPHTICEWGIGRAKETLDALRGKKNAGAYRDIFRFDGPSRVSGNSLNTLLDAFLITGSRKYMGYAEKVIGAAVSTEDDFGAMALIDSEKRWMYLVFLSALGRFLDLKVSLNEKDGIFRFSKKVLLRYAVWMADAERPFLETPEQLEFPTETWAAQDIRKADVFAWAARYSRGDLHRRFKERCRFFFFQSLEELAAFDTCYYTRPLAVILSNGHMAMALLSGKIRGEASAVEETGGGAYPQPEASVSKGLADLIRTFSLKREVNWIRLIFQRR